MAAGQIGEPGATVALHVAVEVKHACVLAPILRQITVVLIVKGEVRSPNLATLMDVQVGVISVNLSQTNKQTQDFGSVVLITLCVTFSFYLSQWRLVKLGSVG